MHLRVLLFFFIKMGTNYNSFKTVLIVVYGELNKYLKFTKIGAGGNITVNNRVS